MQSADQVQKPEKPKPNPWRFSWFTWNQAATTTLLGVGRDNLGNDGEQYTMDFTFTPRYYFYDHPTDQVSVGAEFGWTTELTNSDTTTNLHEVLFKDMQFNIAYNHVFQNDANGKIEEGEYKFLPGISGRVILPTSKASADEGKYLLTTLGLSARSQIRLLGNSSDWLSNIIVIPSVTWAHLFSRSYDPTNADLDRPRQDASGTTIFSDQLTMASFDMDRVAVGLTYFFPIWKSISFGQTYRLSHSFQHQWSTQCVAVSTGQACPTVDETPNGVVTQGAVTTFDSNFSWFPDNNWGHVSLGYQNETGQLGPDGQHRNFFYSPDAQFYLDLVAHFDGIMDAIRGQKEEPGQRSRKNATTIDPRLHF